MLTQNEVTALYHQFRPMLYKKAHEISKVSGLPFEDLKSEAHVIFMADAIPQWDPSKASFCTHLHHKLRKLETKSTRATKKRGRWVSTQAPAHSGIEETLDLLDITPTPDPGPIRDLEIMEQINKVLQGDAKVLAELILDKQLDPPVIKGNSNRQSIRLNAWKCYVRRTQELGWTLERTGSAWDTLSTAMASYFLGLPVEV